MENMSDKIIKTIQSMTGKYGVYNIFEDWVRMMAMAYANQIEYSQKRENEYIETMRRYDESEKAKMCEMTAWLVEWAESEMTDMLGYIYMHLELGSKAHGQFFTPYNICRMMAKMQKYDGHILKVNEPSCGAGGNIIALAEALKEQGINYQQKMEVVCQDIDTKAVYMTYVQMCLFGIPAIVYQANTLSDPNGLDSVTGKMYSVGYMLKMSS
jgi:type I restriction-modification system DNA methylase subunit